MKDMIEKHAINGEISAEIRKNLKVLNLGCGVSTMSEDMYDEGYRQIWNIDLA